MGRQQKHKQKPKTRVKKGARKAFYEVRAPLTSSKIMLYGYSPEDLDGQTVKLDLTRSLKGRGFELKLRVVAKDKELTGNPESLELTGSYIRRSMRKGVDYVEDSFSTDCKDYTVRIKPFLITRRRVSRAVLKALRDLAKKNIEAYVKVRDANEIFSDIMSNKFQKALSIKLKKIYPLALCEIRVFRLEKPLGKEVKKVEKKEEEIKDKKEDKKDE